MTTGVYRVRNIKTDKVYIGSTSTSLKERFSWHRAKLRHNKHPNIHLQRAWNKYTEESFVFEVIEEVESKLCLKREQYWLDEVKPYKKEVGYNLSPTASSVLGVVWSEESRKRMSDTKKGRKLSEESIRKRTEKQKGMKRTAETKKRLSDAAKKRGITPELRRKLNEGLRSPETRKKASERMIGVRPDEEVRRVMGLAQKQRFSKKGVPLCLLLGLG